MKRIRKLIITMETYLNLNEIFIKKFIYAIYLNHTTVITNKIHA